MLPDRVSNPGPLTYESGALPIALRGPANTGVLQNRNESVSEIIKVWSWTIMSVKDANGMEKRRNLIWACIVCSNLSV